MDSNRLTTSTQTDTQFDLGIEGVATGEGVPSTKNEYWTIRVPYGYVRGNCNNTITVGAVLG